MTSRRKKLHKQNRLFCTQICRKKWHQRWQEQDICQWLEVMNVLYTAVMWLWLGEEILWQKWRTRETEKKLQLLKQKGRFYSVQAAVSSEALIENVVRYDCQFSVCCTVLQTDSGCRIKTTTEEEKKLVCRNRLEAFTCWLPFETASDDEQSCSLVEVFQIEAQ